MYVYIKNNNYFLAIYTWTIVDFFFSKVTLVPLWTLQSIESIRCMSCDIQDEKAGSILDKDPEAKAMLSLIDKGPHSEGLRDRDPMADFPEEHSLPAGLGWSWEGLWCFGVWCFGV